MDDAAINGVSDSSIYTGIWTNWSHGYIRGATITLSKRDGGFLTAFLALFVAMVGKSFWRLFCLTAHTVFSSSAAQNGLYHQRQAILRNSNESVAGFKSLTQLAWSWRHRSTKLSLKMVPLMIVSAILMIGFYTAGIFSSKISTVMADEVLISSSKCGMIEQSPDIGTLYNDIVQYISKLNVASASFAQQCYGNNTASRSECSTFVKTQMPQIIARNASCPFPGKKICRRESTNLRIDSGPIDSHKDLGMNAAPQDRFTYRNVLECAPLHTQGYTRTIASNDSSNSNSTFQLLYGSANAAVHNDSGSFQWPVHIMDGIQDYMIRSVVYEPGDSFSTFVPIPELLRDDAIVTLFFLTADAINFIQPVDDEFFAAHIPVSARLVGAKDPMKVYRFDEVAHALGCTTQIQFCVTGNSCTSLTSWLPAINAARNMTTTDKQRESLKVFAAGHEFLGTAIHNTVNVLGASSLIARNSFIGGVQGTIEPDQWQREAEHWQATTTTVMQRMVVEYATGPSDARAEKYAIPPTGNAKYSCRNQKVRSTSHTSFSVLGLCIVLILGGAIILVEISIPPIIRAIQKRYRVGVYQRLEWISNETLQIQRMAHEELGAGTWIEATGDVPMTEKDQYLAKLDVSNEKHPRLAFEPVRLDGNRPGDEKDPASFETVACSPSIDSSRNEAAESSP